jgi:hypothetical protein
MDAIQVIFPVCPYDSNLCPMDAFVNSPLD